jgi:hypothetical protein
MVQFRVGMQFTSRLTLGEEVKLIERLPSEHWDKRQDPEWVVDLSIGGKKYDTKVFAESKISAEYLTDKQ